MITYEDPHKPEPISAVPDAETKQEQKKPKHTKIKFFIFVMFSVWVAVSFVASAPSNFTKSFICISISPSIDPDIPICGGNSLLPLHTSREKPSSDSTTAG